jgi:hypothetical protein
VISKAIERRAYETGRADERDHPAKVEAWSNSPPLAQIDPLPLIQRIVEDEVAERIGTSSAIRPDPAPSAPQEKPKAETEKAGDRRMSDALAEFLKPVDPKRRHTTKGRYEAEPIVKFAIQFLGDPRFCDIKPEDWKRLDEALTDIPKTKNIPAETAQTLFGRFKYAEQKGWKGLTRITEKTLKSKYWGGLHKFLDWSIANRFYEGARPKFECIDPENTQSLDRDAFEDKEIIPLLSLPLFTGCRNGFHVWKPGKYFVQSHLYWGYLLHLHENETR